MPAPTDVHLIRQRIAQLNEHRDACHREYRDSAPYGTDADAPTRAAFAVVDFMMMRALDAARYDVPPAANDLPLAVAYIEAIENHFENVLESSIDLTDDKD